MSEAALRKLPCGGGALDTGLIRPIMEGGESGANRFGILHIDQE